MLAFLVRPLYILFSHSLADQSILVFNQSSTKITKEFFNTGILPKAQNSTFVTVYTPGMVRGPIEDPYLVPTGAEAGDVDSGAVVEEAF
jgi:hypothetical protein